MDDLEFNGTAPLGEEPAKEPAPIPEEPEVPRQPASENTDSDFYTWVASAQASDNSAPQKRESAFASSPFIVTPSAQSESSAPWGQSSGSKSRKTKKRKSKSGKKNILPLIALLICVTLLVAVFLLNCQLNSMNTQLSNMNTRLDSQAQQITNLENRLNSSQNSSRPQFGTATGDTPVRVPGDVMTPAEVYAQCVPSVVAINCTGIGYNNFGQAAQTASSGSGFILSADGYIVTNYHVVENSKTIEISMYDGTTYMAEYIGGNEANDIALIKVDAQNLSPVIIGSSSDLIVGDQVAAIGNPLGELASTLTVGYVSAKDRIVTSEGTQINMLQTDAAINPGNSGGPLFNMRGEVVGITSAKYSGTTTSGATIEGIGFAIPTDDVMIMLEDLKNFGHVTGGFLGVTVSEVDQETSELYGLPMGVLVREVMPGSCAEKGGMRSQDIIISLGGNEVKNMNGLSRALNKCKAGQEVIVTVYRGGRNVDLTVVLDERPVEEEEEPQVTEPTTRPYNPWAGDGLLDDWFGQFFG